jgi:hypothetical protein
MAEPRSHIDFQRSRICSTRQQRGGWAAVDSSLMAAWPVILTQTASFSSDWSSSSATTSDSSFSSFCRLVPARRGWRTGFKLLTGYRIRLPDKPQMSGSNQRGNLNWQYDGSSPAPSTGNSPLSKSNCTDSSLEDERSQPIFRRSKPTSMIGGCRNSFRQQ